jgi:iron complex transport system substrate-binding protein
MKTKNKVIALLEIAIVLCSVFLVATLPAIATDQNQTMQKASASTVTTSSEDDYVLGVYGNANEDDTIDMRDLTYVKLIFFGKKPETELADAKYDGEINPLDFIQIKLIIVGKEKELTIEIPATTQQTAQIVTVRKPVERIVVLSRGCCEVEALRALNAADKIVGVGKETRDKEVYYQELSKLPCVGASFTSPDYEAILNLNPDILLPFIRGKWIDEKKLPGVTVIGLDLRHPEGFTERVRLLGYILDKEEVAEEYLNWHEGWINKIKSRTEALSEDEKPRIFHFAWYFGTSTKPGASYRTTGKTTSNHAMYNMAGGINIAEDIKVSWAMVDAKWVIEQNPDIIVAGVSSRDSYGADDPSEMAAIREDILNRPELAKVTAVKTGRIYIIDHLDISVGGSSTLIGTAYCAKWFHPELFADLDPQEIHQEYLTRFQHLDYDLDKHGVFVYPEQS